MFLDGITYAAISRNIAIGKGSFWAPLFRSDVFFAEHPPMMFGLEALFFKVFGDHYLIEKLYCFVIWLATALMIRRLWNYTLQPSKYSYVLPMLLWSIIPTVTWAYTNNLLDTTMALFDLLAVFAIYKALKSNNRLIVGILLGSVFIACALLTKGPVGAFPTGVPVAYWVAYGTKDIRSLTKHILYSFLLLAVTALTFIILYQFPEPHANITRYLDQQLFSAMSGRREITGSEGFGRLQMIYDLFVLLLIPIGISIVLLLVSKILKLSTSNNSIQYKKHFLFFLLIGLGGSLPILISIKQRSFYLLPALPNYIIALSILAYPIYHQLTERLAMSNKRANRYKLIAAIAAIGLTVYLGSKVNDIGRDKEMITEIKIMSDVLPNDRVIGICSEMENDYSFLSYIQRYNGINVSGNFLDAPFVIASNEMCGADFVKNIKELGYTLVHTNLEEVQHLYKEELSFKLQFYSTKSRFPDKR